MAERKDILRWLTVAAVLQTTLIFLVDFVFTKRLSTVGNNVRDALYRANVSVAQVDNVTQAFASISNDVYWGFLIGMILTAVGFGLLRAVIKKAKPT